MAHGEDARSRRALGDDHHEARGCHRQHAERLAPGHIGQAERWQPARYRTDDRDAVSARSRRSRSPRSFPPPRRARSAAAVRGDGRGVWRPPRGPTARASAHASCGRPCKSSQSCSERARRLHGDAEHAAQHRDADLEADASEKADQHRAGKKIREETELEDARGEQQGGGEQRHHADQRHVLGALRRRHVREGAREDGRGGGVGGDHQVARRSEERERDDRQEHGVKAGHDRRPRDARVAQHLRDVHRSECDAGEHVAQHTGAAHGPDAVEQPHARRRALVAIGVVFCAAARCCRAQAARSCAAGVGHT